MNEVHAFVNGVAYQFKMADIDVGELSSDSEIKQKVAGEIGVDENLLSNFVIDKAEGNVIVRPMETFG